MSQSLIWQAVVNAMAGECSVYYAATANNFLVVSDSMAKAVTANLEHQ